MGGACFDALIGMAASLSTNGDQLIQAGCKFVVPDIFWLSIFRISDKSTCIAHKCHIVE
jgi:hypothetical protein